MAFTGLASWALLVGTAVALGPFDSQHPRLDPRAKCLEDNCYRAVQHTTGFFASRGGTVECSSYLISTITPPTSTITVTKTQSFAATATSDVVKTVTVTQTPVESKTATETIATITSYFVANYAPGKRAAETVLTIPDYAASACGAKGDITSRYISACSCLGVTATTVSAATPTTTTTVVVSSTSVALELHTIVAGTNTVTAPTLTTTVATAGVTEIVSIAQTTSQPPRCASTATSFFRAPVGQGTSLYIEAHTSSVGAAILLWSQLPSPNEPASEQDRWAFALNSTGHVYSKARLQGLPFSFYVYAGAFQPSGSWVTLGADWQQLPYYSSYVNGCIDPNTGTLSLEVGGRKNLLMCAGTNVVYLDIDGGGMDSRTDCTRVYLQVEYV